MNTKYKIEELQAFAINKNGKCLEAVYTSNKTKMLWECAKGHQWKAAWGDIRIGKWCLVCSGKIKGTLIECQDFAEKEHNGKCLSTIYINAQTKMNWECSEGHQWQTSWNDIKNNKTWCPYCAKNVKPLISECQIFATNKGGKLLSLEYKNANIPLLWECSKRHQWGATWHNVKNGGTWCLKCSGKDKPDISLCQVFAKRKKGRLLSTNYTNNITKMLWECSKGHQWKACWKDIKDSGNWCPTCSGRVKPHIEELQKFAKNKNGKLLSTKYITNSTKMLWECSKGHQWKAIWNSIRQGKWCPECSSFKTEYRCKELLEQKLGIKLTKTTFKYNNHKYQWDGYNKEYKIVFEYQGIQHYIYPNFWQKTLEEHKKAKQRDLDKIQYAKENNIKLIVIPYTEEKNLEEYITNQINLLNIRT